MLLKPSSPHRSPGAVLLLLATLSAAASLSLAWPTGNAIQCDRLAPLAVLAALSSALIALSFRALSRSASGPSSPARTLAAAALLLASLTLFWSARFVAHTYGACRAVQEQLRLLHGQP